MNERLWWFLEKLKHHFWCHFFHRNDRCFPETWGRGLAGPWHCHRCRPCGEFFDAVTGKPLKGLWNQVVKLH